MIDRWTCTRINNFNLIYILSEERMWLPTDKKLFDQEIFKRDSSPPMLYFAVRYMLTQGNKFKCHTRNETYCLDNAIIIHKYWHVHWIENNCFYEISRMVFSSVEYHVWRNVKTENFAWGLIFIIWCWYSDSKLKHSFDEKYEFFTKRDIFQLILNK